MSNSATDRPYRKHTQKKLPIFPSERIYQFVLPILYEIYDFSHIYLMWFNISVINDINNYHKHVQSLKQYKNVGQSLLNRIFLIRD